jgi:hypothetical protein
MHEHDGLASVELLEDRLVNSIPQPLVVVTGHEYADHPPQPLRLAPGAHKRLDIKLQTYADSSSFTHLFVMSGNQ